jgi:NOL1/NOP2/fmu family ribosome biogenesis protein
MRWFTVLVIFMVIFASCGSGPDIIEPADSHAVPPRGGRSATPAPGDPVEKRSIVKFADGSVDEYTESTWDASGKKLLIQERFSASGQMVEQIEYSYYDDGDLLSTKITRGGIDNKLKGRVVYQYDKQNNLTLEGFVNSKGKQVSANGYTYDDKSNVLSRVIYNASNVKLTETIYNYQNGLVVSSETRDNQGRKISSAENKYDGNGNLINQVVYNAGGQVSRRINAEWQNGREVKNEQLSASGQVQIRITNEYGSQGQLVKRTIENIEGQSTQILEFEYTFQQQGSRSRS